MSVTTRTNLATNPSAETATTGYGVVPGTGGACTGNRSTGGTYPAYTGAYWFGANWTTATTAVSGGVTYLQTGLTAGTTYTVTLQVRSNIGQKVNLSVAFKNSSSTTVNTVTSAAATLTPNTWTQFTITGVAGTGVDRLLLTVAATTGGTTWGVGNSLDVDGVLIEAAATAGTYFDGSYAGANSTVYAWTGTANASTSTATLYTPALALVGHPDMSPCPRVEITLTDLVPSDCTVNIWRTADGERTSVRSARGISVVGSTFITDYEPPLGRNVQYDLEVLDGAGAGAVAPSQHLTVTTVFGVIQDPLVPNTAIAVYGKRTTGQLSLQAQSVKNLEYAAGTSLIPILGSSKPVAILGQVMAAANVPYSVLATAAEQSTQLRDLLQQSPLLLIRSIPGWGDSLPGLVYTAGAKTVEQPFPRNGQNLTLWQLTVNSIASPRLDVLVPIWTYGDVQNLWATYQQEQDTFAAKTYLDALKSPTGI